VVFLFNARMTDFSQTAQLAFQQIRSRADTGDFVLIARAAHLVRALAD
jgi:hypothetical protein